MQSAVLSPPVLSQLPPPYERFEALGDVPAEAALVAIAIAEPREEWPAVTRLVPALRARFPAAPVALRMRRPAAPEDLEWARRAGALRVRAMLFEGEPPRLRLERALTEPRDFPEELEQWLTIRLPALGPDVIHLVREIVRLAPEHAEVSSLLGRMGRAERTVRTWFHAAGIPGPGKWLAVAHAICAALRLQRDRSAPLLTVAVESGYSDHSSLSRQSLRLFGVRPGRIRETLGWEWLLDRWLRGVSQEAGSGRFAHRPPGDALIV